MESQTSIKEPEIKRSFLYVNPLWIWRRDVQMIGQDLKFRIPGPIQPMFGVKLAIGRGLNANSGVFSVPFPLSRVKLRPMMNRNGAGRQSSDDQTVEENKNASSKRRSDDGSAAQTRAKRNRYISIACNECKRRKIKCNGEAPCNRCGNLSLACVYSPNCCSNGFKDSDEYRQISSHLQTLQDQLNNLYASLNNLQNKYDGGLQPVFDSLGGPQAAGPLDPQIAFPTNSSTPSAAAQAQNQQYPDITSSTYSLNHVNSSLRTIGITQSGYTSEEVLVAQSKPLGTPSSTPTTATIPQQSVSIVKDPLWSLDQEEALRLCRLYADEMGLMYPMLDVDKTMDKARTLFRFLNSIRRVGLMKDESERGDSFYDEETLILKMIIAAAATVEGNGQSELGQRLFENVRRIMNVEDRMGKPATVQGLQLLVLVAEYYFHLDEEIQAYRFIGIAARQCFELGLHRRDILTSMFSTEEDLVCAIRLFWVIYVLDRRWSFGTGMPFSMQDTDIDPALPEPDDDVPYLRLMVNYGKISSKVWTSISGLDNSDLNVRKEEIGYLDYQIKQWQSSIPDALRYSPEDDTMGPEEMSRGQRRLRVMLYLRASQLRIQLYRPVLYTMTSIMENRGYAQTVIEIAKDSIQTLMQLNQTSDIYRSQQVSFHYFLVAALAVLFLAVSHAPVEFSRQVRDEFYMALDLIKGFRCKSYISKRLWKTIRGLKKFAPPRLGLVSGQALATANDPHSSAAVAMAGLAGHSVDEASLFSAQSINSLENDPIDGQQISYELTNLFEAAGGYGDLISGKADEIGLEGMDVGDQGEPGQGLDSFSAMWRDDTEFVKVMKECF